METNTPISEAYNMDCMELMAQYPENYFDLAVVDPPYGIKINMNMGRRKGKPQRHKVKKWDNQIPEDKYFEEVFRVSKNQIVWGGNYFPYIWRNGCNHFIFWDKLTPSGLSFSDGELAWTSYNKANRKYTLYNITNEKIHPTQKPVALYDWIFHNYAKPTDKILDTHLGSGSSRIAAYKNKLHFVSCELDQEYFQAQEKRFSNFKSQLTLF